MEPVPDGTVQEVLDWVGDDPDRAERALEAERLGDGRSTLISKLEAIASATEEDSMADEVEEVAPEQPKEITVNVDDSDVLIGPVHVRDHDVEIDESIDMRTVEGDIDCEQVESLQSAAARNGLVLSVNGQNFAFNAQMTAVLKQIADQAIAGVTL